MSLAAAPFFPSLPAKDLDRAKRWYEEKLGLTPVMELGWGGLAYQSGGSNWIIYQTPSAGTGKHTLGGWVVTNIDDAMRELRANGVTFEEYALGDQGPNTENGVSRDPNGGAVAWFKDSEDNVVSITELPPGFPMPG